MRRFVAVQTICCMECVTHCCADAISRNPMVGGFVGHTAEQFVGISGQTAKSQSSRCGGWRYGNTAASVLLRDSITNDPTEVRFFQCSTCVRKSARLEGSAFIGLIRLHTNLDLQKLDLDHSTMHLPLYCSLYETVKTLPDGRNFSMNALD